MTSQPLPTTRRQGIRLPVVNRAVDIGFAILLVVCGVRYFTHHELAGAGVLALVLAIGAGASYAVAVLGRSGVVAPARTSALVGTRQGIGLLTATTFWLPLVVIAPSFGWCAFALFFAVHRVLSGWVAFGLSALIVVAVSLGLLIMSNGQDLGLVLGPFFGGMVLASAYGALDRAAQTQRGLIDELIDTRQQLARSERDAGALAERERVAGELHDTVVQRTASALLLLESDQLQGGDTSPAVLRARDALRESLVETRRLVHGLADPALAAASLPAILGAEAAAAGASFEVDGVERAVSTPVLHALQRVVQEALVNAGKYAQADRTQVTLTFFNDEIGVDIADDGVGFASGVADDDADDVADAVSGGFGIRAMTWRLQNLGGRLTIESHPGEGTVVAALVPDLAAAGEAP